MPGKKYYLILTANFDLYNEHGDISVDNMINAVNHRKNEIKECQPDQNDEDLLNNYGCSQKARFFPQGVLVNLIHQSSDTASSDYIISSYRFFDVEEKKSNENEAVDTNRGQYNLR